MPAHAAVASIHDVVADDDALDGHVLARTAVRAFVIDTKSALGQKVRHIQVLRAAHAA